MNTNTNNTKTATKRAGLAAALLAAAAMLGGLAIRDAAIANALDHQRYWECVSKIPKDSDPEDFTNMVFVCCIQHGGEWLETQSRCNSVLNPDGSKPTGPSDPAKPTVVNPKPPTRQG